MNRKGKLLLGASFAMLVVLGSWVLLATRKPAQLSPSATRRPRPSLMPIRADQAAPAREGALCGSVRRRDGQAIENARVCATTVRSEVFWAPRLTCATTDKSGSYRITPLESTVYAVSAVARGFQPASAQRGQGIFLDRGEAKTGVDITLDAGGGQLSGQVLDATGGPISGATIRVLRRATPHETTVTQSAADGTFSVWMATGAVTVLAEAPEYAPVRIAHIVPSRDLVLKLTPGSVVRGHVVAAGTGAPVEGVEIRAIRPGSWNNPTQPSTTSEAEGAFELRGLEPGMYTLVGERRGWRGESGTPFEVALASQVDGLTLVVSKAALVTGKVVRQGTSEPCPRGKVLLGPPERGPASGTAPLPSAARTPTLATDLEVDGTARFAAVPAGTYRVNVQCADFRLVEGPTTLEIGTQNVDGLLWTVDPGIRIVVHALDRAEQPVPNVPLLLREGAPNQAPAAPGGRPVPPVRAFMTSTDGTFELTGLAPGPYSLEAETGDGTKPVLVDAHGSHKVDATIHVEGRGRILVTVRSPEGIGIDQVEVTATPARAGGSATSPGVPRAQAIRGTGNGDGQFEIGPLVGGAYHVTVSDGVNAAQEPHDWPQGTVQVGDGIARAAVVLRRGGALTGRVVDEGGHGVPDLWITADCSTATRAPSLRMVSPIALRPGAASRALSDQDGRFRVDGIANDATCMLRATQPGNGKTGVAHDAHPGQETVVTVRSPGEPRDSVTLQLQPPRPAEPLAVQAPRRP